MLLLLLWRLPPPLKNSKVWLLSKSTLSSTMQCTKAYWKIPRQPGFVAFLNSRRSYWLVHILGYWPMQTARGSSYAGTLMLYFMAHSVQCCRPTYPTPDVIPDWLDLHSAAYQHGVVIRDQQLRGKNTPWKHCLYCRVQKEAFWYPIDLTSPKIEPAQELLVLCLLQNKQ